MIEMSDLHTLCANQRLLAIELINRGIEVSIFDWPNEILEANFAGRNELFIDIDNSTVPYAASVISGSKSLTKTLLSRAGLAVPVGHHFSVMDRDAIIAFALSYLNFPVVLKPSNGNQGQNVHTGLESEAEIRHALQSIHESRGNVEVLIEEQFQGAEYRIFITRTGEYAILHRDPAHVVGDGVHTIKQLADRESERRLNPRLNCLCAIEIDIEAERYLRKQGLSTEYVPATGEKVYVRGSSNVKMGGVPEDFTDRAHASAVSLAWKALLSIPGLPYAGIDFMTADITAPQTETSYCILEINSVPGIGMHMAPGRGSPRNVAGMIVNIVFPESIQRMAA